MLLVYVYFMLLNNIIVILLFIYPIDTLHIHKRVAGGTLDSLQWDSSFTMNAFADCFPMGHHVDILVSIEKDVEQEPGWQYGGRDFPKKLLS